MLYSRRFGPWFISPIVAGLDDKNRPFISSYDLIGAPSDSDDFVVSGSCSDQLFGICESLHHSGMVIRHCFSYFYTILIMFRNHILINDL